MRILVVNVNTTQSMTDTIAETARSAAGPGTEIVALTPLFGAESVEGNYESYVAAVAVMETVRRYPEPFDAVIQAGYGEHGREGLQELLEVPVVDITEAAASIAQFLGHRYSVVTTLDRAVPLIEDRLLLAGLSQRCASVRASGMAVLDLEADPAAAVEAIVVEAEKAVTEDRAEVICLGCGGMAGPRRAGGGPHRCPGRRRGRRGRDHRRVAGPAGSAYLEGPHLRPTPSEGLSELAA